MPKRIAAITAATISLATIPAFTSAAQAHPSGWFANCTAVNTHWSHGIGKRHAHDSTSGIPVTSFKRSTRLYRHATWINSGLDRDKDGIACEKA